VLQFWYRQSPRPLVAMATSGDVVWSEPPLQVSGLAGVRYDLRGRLTGFYSVPPEVENPGEAAAEPDWTPLFAEARLDPAALKRVPPARTTPFFSDQRAAWEGTWPQRRDIGIRVEAASYHGRPVFFEIVNPWTRAERMQAFQPTAGQTMARTLVILLLVVLTGTGAVLARRNLRLGRGDRGGFRPPSLSPVWPVRGPGERTTPPTPGSCLWPRGGRRLGRCSGFASASSRTSAGCAPGRWRRGPARSLEGPDRRRTGLLFGGLGVA
jgi:hypothetical protein